MLAACKRLGVERIDLWQLHRIDPKVPRDEQFGVIAGCSRKGSIRHVGLSEVSVDEIEAAQKFFPVATVQNRYNLVDRTSEDVLDYCASSRHRLHPVVSAGRRRPRQARLAARPDRQEARRDAEPDRARLGAEALAR